MNNMKRTLLMTVGLLVFAAACLAQSWNRSQPVTPITVPATCWQLHFMESRIVYMTNSDSTVQLMFMLEGELAQVAAGYFPTPTFPDFLACSMRPDSG